MSWKVLKNALLYCTSWHSTNDPNTVRWSLAAVLIIPPTQWDCPGALQAYGQALVGMGLLTSEEKNDVRNPGRYIMAFTVFAFTFFTFTALFISHVIQKSEETVDRNCELAFLPISHWVLSTTSQRIYIGLR